MIVQCKDQTFSGVQAIIFDKDGTLCDVETFLWHLGKRRSHRLNAAIPGIEDAVLLAFGFHQQHLNPGGLLAVGTRHENEIAAATCIAQTGRDWIEARAIAQAAFAQADQGMPRKAEATPLFSEVLELLNRLRSAGIQLALLSSDSPQNVRDFAARYALESYFSVLKGVEGPLQKPDPKLVDQVCEILGVSPQDVLVIGDAQSDLKMGQSAGVKGCIGVLWGWKILPQLPDADILIHRCTEIKVLP